MTLNMVKNYCEGVKCENPDQFVHISPILDSFHIEISFRSAIYKRLKESNIEDLFVEAGLIAQVSVVQALCSSYYKWVTRLYKLFHKAMLCILMSHGKKKNLVPSTHLNNQFKSIGKTGLVKSVSFCSKVFCMMKTFQNMLKTCLRCRKAIIIW